MEELLKMLLEDIRRARTGRELYLANRKAIDAPVPNEVKRPAIWGLNHDGPYYQKKTELEQKRIQRVENFKKEIAGCKNARELSTISRSLYEATTDYSLTRTDSEQCWKALEQRKAELVSQVLEAA